MNSEEQKANEMGNVDPQYENYKATIADYEKTLAVKDEAHSKSIKMKELEIEGLKSDVATVHRVNLNLKNENEALLQRVKGAENAVLAQKFYKEDLAERKVIMEKVQNTKKFTDLFTQKLDAKLRSIRSTTK